MARNRVVLEFTDSNPLSVSKTKQSFKNEVNINKIMARARKTGLLPVASVEPYFGDFSSAVDFATAQNKIIAAEAAFNSLPAVVRAKFENDPGKLMDFLSKEENMPEAVKLGLLKQKEPSADQIAADKATHEAERLAKLKADLKAVGVNVA